MTKRKYRSAKSSVIYQASAEQDVSTDSESLSEAQFLGQQALAKVEKMGIGTATKKTQLKSAPIGFAPGSVVRSNASSAASTPAPTPTEVDPSEPGDESTSNPQDENADSHSPDGSTDEPLTMAALQSFLDGIQSSADDRVREAEEAAQQAIALSHEELEAAKQQVNQVTNRLTTLEGVFKLAGSSTPHNQRSAQGASSGNGWTPAAGTPSYLQNFGTSKEPQGAIAHALDMMASDVHSPTKIWQNPHNGDEYKHRDYSQVRSFYRSNKQEFKQSFETLLKNNGFLRGGVVRNAVPGYTSPNTVPDNYLEVLSLMMRESHSPKYIWWQFPITINQPGFGPASNILIPRYSWLDEPQSEADFIGAELDGTYFEVNNTNQALIMTTVPALVKEYMLGRGTAVGNRPVAIPEFFSAYSLTSLEQALNTRIGHNYRGFEDMMCRKPYLSTLQVRYNNGEQVVDTPGEVMSDGTMNHRFLNYLYAHMVGDMMIPPLEDGSINLVTNPTAIAQIKDGLDEKMDSPTSDQIINLSNMLQADGNNDMIDRVSGYVGTVNNFNLFQSNNQSLGTPGSLGVQNERMGVDAAGETHTTYSSWAIGRAAAGRGVGMEMEVRSEGSGAFGRSTRWIWISHEGYVPIDVCPNPANPDTASQQTRVVEIRTTANAVAA